MSSVIEKMFDYTITSLDWARNHLDPSAVEKAVALLRSANAIEFFGFGASGIVARDAQQKFPLFGVACGAQLDSHQQIMVASMMRPGDVAVAISNAGRTRSVVEIAKSARASGAKVIGVTGSNSPLAAERNVALIVEALDNTNIYTPTISRIAVLVVEVTLILVKSRSCDHEAWPVLVKPQLRFVRYQAVSGMRLGIKTPRQNKGAPTLRARGTAT